MPRAERVPSLKPVGPALAALALLVSGCVPRPAPPPPAPPSPPEAPAPPPPAAAPVGWEEAELSAGDWSYAPGPPPTARFGPPGAPSLLVRCEAGRILLVLPGRGGGAGAIAVRTSFGERALPAAPQPAGLAAAVAASDPLLDAIAFSRGRFAVGAAGAPPLVLPAWPEPARVVEECRA